MARDVSDLAEALEASALSELFMMSPEQLLAAVLAPVSFSRQPVEMSAILVTLANSLRVAPAHLIASCLVAQRGTRLAADLAGVADP